MVKGSPFLINSEDSACPCVQSQTWCSDSGPMAAEGLDLRGPLAESLNSPGPKRWRRQGRAELTFRLTTLTFVPVRNPIKERGMTSCRLQARPTHTEDTVCMRSKKGVDVRVQNSQFQSTVTCRRETTECRPIRTFGCLGPASMEERNRLGRSGKKKKKAEEGLQTR